MVKEIKYSIYILSILLFFYFVGKYYISDTNIKNSNLAINNFQFFLKDYSKNLPIINNESDEIIEFSNNNSNSIESEFSFWNLLKND